MQENNHNFTSRYICLSGPVGLLFWSCKDAFRDTKSELSLCRVHSIANLMQTLCERLYFSDILCVLHIHKQLTQIKGMLDENGEQIG